MRLVRRFEARRYISQLSCIHHGFHSLCRYEEVYRRESVLSSRPERSYLFFSPLPRMLGATHPLLPNQHQVRGHMQRMGLAYTRSTSCIGCRRPRGSGKLCVSPAQPSSRADRREQAQGPTRRSKGQQRIASCCRCLDQVSL